MTYRTYEVSIEAGDSMKFLEVVAVDAQAAHADIRAAYGDEVVIVCTTVVA